MYQISKQARMIRVQMKRRYGCTNSNVICRFTQQSAKLWRWVQTWRPYVGEGCLLPLIKTARLYWAKNHNIIQSHWFWISLNPQRQFHIHGLHLLDHSTTYVAAPRCFLCQSSLVYTILLPAEAIGACNTTSSWGNEVIKSSLVLCAGRAAEFVVVPEATEASLVHEVAILHPVHAWTWRFAIGGFAARRRGIRKPLSCLKSAGDVANTLVSLLLVAGLGVAGLAGVGLCGGSTVQRWLLPLVQTLHLSTLHTASARHWTLWPLGGVPLMAARACAGLCGFRPRVALALGDIGGDAPASAKHHAYHRPRP